ncbi:hypothetical protein O181_063321 [Austropuccinia psidii MF-1]|uniref:Uncharacterized protein n=1 Tax=Austropuccinia psidii MF-1 TaxID=1389203 RepID=A0A9Q3EJU0_9BASI|nr:hypothetical protein [Austropuccinia psidii MF-1]
MSIYSLAPRAQPTAYLLLMRLIRSNDTEWIPNLCLRISDSDDHVRPGAAQSPPGRQPKRVILQRTGSLGFSFRTVLGYSKLRRPFECVAAETPQPAAAARQHAGAKWTVVESCSLKSSDDKFEDGLDRHPLLRSSVLADAPLSYSWAMAAVSRLLA